MSSPWLTLGLVGACASLIWAADDPKKDQPKSLADQIAAIKQEHQEAEKKFYDELRIFRDDDKKISDLNTEHGEITRKQADKLKALIKEHGKEPAAFDGILVFLGELRHPLDDDMVQLVLQHHSANPKMGQLCFDLQYRSTEAWAKKMLKEAAAKHPDKAVRGQAVYSLGVYHRYRAQPYGEKIPEDEQAKRFDEAAEYFTEVTKNYAAVTTPDGKAELGAKAASELIRIKNLPNLKIGKTAPEIVGEDIDGKKFKLSDYRGKVVLLDFWGHW
jgi:hypothetical protein